MCFLRFVSMLLPSTCGLFTFPPFLLLVADMTTERRLSEIFGLSFFTLLFSSGNKELDNVQLSSSVHSHSTRLFAKIKVCYLNPFVSTGFVEMKV